MNRLLRRAELALGVVTLALFTGCSCNPAPLPIVDASSLPDGPSSDGGTALPDADDADDAGDAVTRPSGNVTLTQLHAPSTQAMLTAFFFDELGIAALREGWAAPGCERLAAEGACVALACPTAIPSLSQAGTLTATIGDAVLSAMPEPSGLYLGFGTGLEIVPGAPIEIRAGGAEVPAFSATVVAPGVMTATLPATARRDATWTIPWSSPGATHVQLLLAGGGTVVRCLTDAGEGSLDVAPEVLATLPAGSTVITLSALNRSEVAAGDFDVLVTVADALGGSIVLE